MLVGLHNLPPFEDLSVCLQKNSICWGDDGAGDCCDVYLVYLASSLDMIGQVNYVDLQVGVGVGSSSLGYYN